MRKSLSIEKIIFAVTVWIFLSLNARMFNFGIYYILRWLLPVFLVLIIAIRNQGKIVAPPALIFAFIAATVPSLFNSSEVMTSFSKIVSFILIIYSFFIFFMGKDTQEEREILLEILLALILLFQVLNLLFCITGMGVESSGRYSGFTTNANTLGIYSNLAFWAAYYFYKKRRGFSRLVFLTMDIVSVVLALLSGSRSAFVMILLNCIIAVYLNVNSIILRIVVTIIIGVVLYFMFSGRLTFLQIDALDRLLADEGMTRGEIWDNGIAVWKENPIFGCGYRISRLYNTNLGTEGMDFHNSYLSLLAEIGIWGASIIVCAIIPVIIKTISEFFSNANSRNKSPIIIAAFMCLSLMINAWSESFLFSVGSTEAFCFWVAFIWILAYLKCKNKNM